MKIIKKLCIPLFSLVLVLGCFSVSTFTANAYSQCPLCGQVKFDGHDCSDRYYTFAGRCYTRDVLNTTYAGCANTISGCKQFRCLKSEVSNGGIGEYVRCLNCGHSVMAHSHYSTGNRHTHNYSTAWGAWKKISACRLSS